KQSFKAAVIPADKDGKTGDEVLSEEFTESYMTGIMPNVTSVKIEGKNSVGETLKAVYTAEDNAGNGKDKYRWYISEDGTNWSRIEGADSSTYTIGIEAIRSYIKCEISVAGREGTYSYWKESENAVLDNSSIAEMIKAVQNENITGKNALMLKLLGKCDPNFYAYSTEIQRKIAVAAITAGVSSEEDYNKLKNGILDGSVNVSVSELDFADKPMISIGSNGEAVNDISFTDLDSVQWARTAILTLCRKGIINGYSNTVFAPNDNISRAEFTALLVRAFYGVNERVSHSFTDVEPGVWYEQYIATAVQNGLAQGRADGSFGPDEPITREEMAIFCSRVLESGKCYIEDVKEYSAFDDENEISEYAHDSVVSVVKKDIMGGMDNNRFSPRERSTRAMAAQVIYAMLGRPVDGEAVSADDIVIEDFENKMSWIFENGYPDNSEVEKLASGSTAYSGTGSVVFKGKAAATVAAGANRYFRIMFYDANGSSGGVDGCLIVEGDKETYTIGANTGDGAYNQGLYYQCRVGSKWYETGVVKSIGWHEFAIDMSKPDKVDMYMDGLLVKSFEDSGTTPQRVVIGNLNDGTSGKYNCYGDDFMMAKSKEVFDAYRNANRPTGNVLISDNPLDISTLPDGVKNMAKLLNALAILPVSEGGGAKASDKVTNEELAYLLSGMQNESAYHKTAQKQYFEDVPIDRWSAGYIADEAEKKLIPSDTKNFKPDEAAKCADAIGAAMKLLGYGTVTASRESKETLAAASELGLTDGVPTGGELTWEAAVRLFSNMLEAKMLRLEIEKNLPSFVKTDVLYMNYKFDVYKIKDTVNGVYGGEFTSQTELDYDEMLIGDYKIKTNKKPVGEYLGMEAKAYVYGNEDEDDYTLIYIADAGTSKKVTIGARDVDGCSGNELKYSIENKQKTLKLSKNLKVIENGSYLFDYGDDNFIFDIGNIRLIDTESDGTYDCAVIEHYEPIKVVGYDTSTKALHDEYTGRAYNLYDVDIVTESFIGRAYPESLTNGTVVLIAAAADEKHADIIAVNDTVQGTITSVSEDKLCIDTKEYNIAKTFAEYVNDKGNGLLNAGSQSVFYIDAFENVVGVQTQLSGGSVYAYVTKIWLDEAGDDVWLKMFTDKGIFIKVVCDTKITINGEVSSPQTLLGKEPQLVKYKLKDGNTLKTIDFADESHKRTLTMPGDNELKGSDKFWLYYSGDIMHWDWYGFGSVINDTNKPIFMVIAPEGYENDDKKYRLGSAGEFGNDKKYNIMAYDADEYNRVQIIVYKPSVAESDKPDNPKDITKTRVFVFDTLSSRLNDDNEVVQMISGWEEGKKVSYEVAEGIDLNAVKREIGYETDWKFGDCLIIGYDREGKVSGAWEHENMANHLNSDPAQQRLYVYSEGESEYSDFTPCYHSDFYYPQWSAFWFGKILKSESGGLVIEGKDGVEFQ
ncbi:MAG: S-layer homology domain-containing protein, partial [Clostridiales bacterium]|nr:S-layer homology domain-containing protein [Clostridiales bacterium]